MSPTLVDFVVLAPFFPQAPGAAFASSLQSTRRGLFFVLEFKGFWKIELGYAFRNQSVVLVTRQHLNISQLDWSSHFDLNGPKESTQCLGIPWKSHLRDLESGEATNQLGIPWNTNFAVRTKHPECSPFLSFSTHYDLKCSPHTCPCCYMLLLISCPRFALYCWLLHSAQAKLQVRLTRTQHFKHFKLKEVSSSLSLSISQYHRQSSYLLQRTFSCQQASAACGMAATVWAIWVWALTSGTRYLSCMHDESLLSDKRMLSLWVESENSKSGKDCAFSIMCSYLFHVLTWICKICRL